MPHLVLVYLNLISLHFALCVCQAMKMAYSCCTTAIEMCRRTQTGLTSRVKIQQLITRTISSFSLLSPANICAYDSAANEKKEIPNKSMGMKNLVNGEPNKQTGKSFDLLGNEPGPGYRATDATSIRDTQTCATCIVSSAGGNSVFNHIAQFMLSIFIFRSSSIDPYDLKRSSDL